jgi:hypothetical protein
VAYYDPETIALMRATLDEAWASLRPRQRAHLSKSVVASHILELASRGERDPVRLRTAVLLHVVNSSSGGGPINKHPN